MTLRLIRCELLERDLTPDGMKWYVIQTQFKQELTAKHNLIRQGFEVFFPQYLKQTSKGAILLPLFSGYLFVRMNVAAVRWQSIHSTIGVSRILGYDTGTSVPAPCRDNVIPGLRSFCDAGDIVDMHRAFPSTKPGVSAAFKQGDSVVVLDGMFKDCPATYWNCTKDASIVILSLLNRPVRVILRSEEIAHR